MIIVVAEILCGGLEQEDRCADGIRISACVYFMGLYTVFHGVGVILLSGNN